ncbi:hypothetical protein EXU48_19310 [Occultella glacieicola]|uniref:Uncharacterized protein n=1 Tax=Occultella glacieicola TaxID=2518684 RepID=A0ABY2DZP9_9MICO|nr:hypothetical protein [Occultella glacieicola]TDE90065.1 hypothetical protein EXU48_19310 [Occultella glacieicola]
MAARTPSVRTRRVIQAVWIVGFVFGTSTHVVDLVVSGMDVYAGFPTGVRLFWTSLTVLDAATVALIAVRRRAGVILGVAVILTDIAVNWTMFATRGGLAPFGVVNQALFAVFILGTMRVLWTWFERPPPAE